MNERIKKLNWKEFLSCCDFSDWYLSGYTNPDENPNFKKHLIKEYDLITFLNHPDVGYDAVEHTVNLANSS